MSTEENPVEEKPSESDEEQNRNENKDSETTETLEVKKPEKHAKWVESSQQDEEGVERTIRVPLPYKPKGEMFAVADSFQGGSRLQVICEDGNRRLARIPGKLRRRMWIRENDLLIIIPWSFQDSKADVKWRYTPTQFANLQRMGKIPEILEIQ